MFEFRGPDRLRDQVPVPAAPEPNMSLALCAPRFPKTLLGIASCTSMGTPHSCTLHAGIPLSALHFPGFPQGSVSCTCSCIAYDLNRSLFLCAMPARQPAPGLGPCNDTVSTSALELAINLALCAPRIPKPYLGTAPCTSMGFPHSGSLQPGSPTSALHSPCFALGSATGISSRIAIDPTCSSSLRAMTVQTLSLALGPCCGTASIDSSSLHADIRNRCVCCQQLAARAEPSFTHRFLSLDRSPWDCSCCHRSCMESLSRGKLPATSATPASLHDGLNGSLPCPDTRHTPRDYFDSPNALAPHVPFAQLCMCFVAFVMAWCRRSVPAVHYRVRRRLRGHIRVMDAAAARLPRTSPLRCFRPGIRVTKGLRFASFHVFVQWHGARFSSQKERIARMASNMLSARAPRVTRCTRASSALACRAGDFLYTRSCVLPVALAYVFGGASLCAGGVLLLACCNTVLPHALNLPPGFGLAAFALLAATLRPIRYGFCRGTKWMRTGARFLALATGLRGPSDLAIEPNGFCSAPLKCVQNACGTALLLSPAASSRDCFLREEAVRAMPILFSNNSPTFCGGTASQPGATAPRRGSLRPGSRSTLRRPPPLRPLALRSCSSITAPHCKPP